MEATMISSSALISPLRFHPLVFSANKMMIKKKKKMMMSVSAAASSGKDHYYGGGRLVDENMIVLRKRIHEMKMVERNYEPPSHWMDWEKRFYSSYDSVICESVGLLQSFLMNSRPTVAIATLLLLIVSVPVSSSVLAFRLLDLLQWVLAAATSVEDCTFLLEVKLALPVEVVPLMWEIHGGEAPGAGGGIRYERLVSVSSSSEMTESKVVVPESVLKKRKREEEWALAKKQNAEAAKKTNAANRKLIYKRAEQYAKEYAEKEKELISLKREAKLKGGFYVDPEAKLLFIIRIRGINAIDPKTKKILQLLRLRQIFNGVFLKVNKATMNMLRRVEPYVTYGFPNLKSVKELIYKRGYGKLNSQRVALTDNSIVEQGLVKHGIICTEDLIHEILTVGPHFKEANNFLWPFQLKAPLGGLKKKRNHYVEGGDAGNRENFINELIRRMN
ncbi:hypothetical protein HID58_033570 [Brassica napus]|uniref:60S ribosomal protein L7-2 n=2 Tax=Brassica napus TaxID=3708 RepID=A0ABQ8BZM3_BRANA|nr:hypothetical protein HID58_033570 [Brassica napus]